MGTFVLIRPTQTFYERIKIDQAFIGSCANGRLEDFAIAAEIVKGKKVAPDVRFIITPGSQEVYKEALKAGYVDTLLEADAMVTKLHLRGLPRRAHGL